MFADRFPKFQDPLARRVFGEFILHGTADRLCHTGRGLQIRFPDTEGNNIPPPAPQSIRFCDQFHCQKGFQLLDMTGESVHFRGKMPLYLYACQSCGKEHERLQKFSDPPLKKCPACGGKVAKKITSTSFLLKGGGWYKDGYASPKPETAKKPETAVKKEEPKKSETKKD